MASTTDWGVRVGSLTDVGQHRKRNEDSFFAFVPEPEGPGSWVGGAFAVADGMGGHDAGDVASQFIVSVLQNSFGEDGIFANPPSTPLLATLESLLHAINQRLHDLSEERGAVRGMGSTVTLGVFYRGRIYIAHVGDSRLYRLRHGALQQLSEDHSWAAEQRRRGLITAEEEERHPQRNLLTECIGVDPRVNVQTRAEAVAPGDRYFFCSDGLHGQVRKADLAAVLSSMEDPQEAVQRLVDAANQAGGPDNITAIIADVGPDMDPGDIWPSSPAESTITQTQPMARTSGPEATAEHETVPSVAPGSSKAQASQRSGPASLIHGLGEDLDIPEPDPLEMTAMMPAKDGKPAIGWVPQEDYLTEEPPTVETKPGSRGHWGRNLMWVGVAVVAVGGTYALTGGGMLERWRGGGSDDSPPPAQSAAPKPATDYQATPIEETTPAAESSGADDPAAVSDTTGSPPAQIKQ